MKTVSKVWIGFAGFVCVIAGGTVALAFGDLWIAAGSVLAAVRPGSFAMGILLGLFSNWLFARIRSVWGGTSMMTDETHMELDMNRDLANAGSSSNLRSLALQHGTVSGPTLSCAQHARQSISAIDTLLNTLNQRISNCSRPCLKELVEAERKLSNLKVTCFVAIGLGVLNNSEVAEYSNVFNAEVQEVIAVAAELQRLTNQSPEVARLLDALGRLRSSVAALNHHISAHHSQLEPNFQ